MGKPLQKPLFFIAALLVLQAVCPFPAHGQDRSENITINVTTNVTTTIELVTIQSISLSKSDAVDNVITINPQISTNAGKMIVRGAPNAMIRIRYLPQRQLTHLDENITLLFNYEITGNDIDEQSSSEPLQEESRELQLNENGRYFIWIGGYISLAEAIPGNYRGEFTVEIEPI